MAVLYVGLIGVALIHLGINKYAYEKLETKLSNGDIGFLISLDKEYEKIKTAFMLFLLLVLVFVLNVIVLEADITERDVGLIVGLFTAYSVLIMEKVVFSKFQYGIVLNQEFFRYGVNGEKVRWSEVLKISREDLNVKIQTNKDYVKIRLSDKDYERLVNTLNSNSKKDIKIDPMVDSLKGSFKMPKDFDYKQELKHRRDKKHL